ncbi:DDE superfamily endonuclease [Popillia japonica]|uniref:DDE superfamily endonuclease n=1 Tax=Popillia japonica TaxID=7064 RepID=A0AAW1M7Z7_POPJA
MQLGRHSLLNVAQEKELCRRIFRLAEVGMPLTQKVLRRSVFTFVEENGLNHPFSIQNRLAGRKWMEKELCRRIFRLAEVGMPLTQKVLRRSVFTFVEENGLNHPFSIQNSHNGSTKAFGLTEYFGKLKQILTDLNIMNQPQRIYKGIRLTLHHQQHVLSRKGAKRVHLIAPEHAESATVVACGNALGQRIPPMVLFKGKRQKPEWIDSMPPGTSIAMTARGSMTAVRFEMGLNHFVKFKSPGWCLLIIDGARSHLDAAIVDAAEAPDIMLLCLPSNTTHELQPSAFPRTLLMNFNHLIRVCFEHLSTIGMRRFLITARKENYQGPVTSKFNPFNKDVNPDVAYAPSTLTERALQTPANLIPLTKM